MYYKFIQEADAFSHGYNILRQFRENLQFLAAESRI